MKTNLKALQLIEKGLSAKTVHKLTESQVNTLHSRLIIAEKKETKEAVTVTKKETTYPATEVDAMKAKGQSIPGGSSVRVNADDSVTVTAEGEVSEEEEVTMDPNKETETQDPKQVGPSSDDGFGDETDGMGMFEGKSNAFSICHSQVGPKKSRKWERCVREVKKQLGEGKNPVSLFLENEIMKIVERNILPRITKGDLIKHLNEEENFATKHLQSFGKKSSPKVKKEVDEQNPSPAPTTKPAPTKPGTKTPPKQRPSHPGKNPNPGENPSPKAKKTSPEKAKNDVIDVIIKMLEK